MTTVVGLSTATVVLFYFFINFSVFNMKSKNQKDKPLNPVIPEGFLTLFASIIKKKKVEKKPTKTVKEG